MSMTWGERRIERWTLGLAALLVACPGSGEDDDGSMTSASSTLTGGSDTTGSDAATDGPNTSDATTTTDPTDDGPADSSGTDGTDTDDTTTAGADCGNGMLDPGEACDDGNGTNADGCNDDCTVSGSVLWFHNQNSGVGQTDEYWSVAVDDEGRAYAVGNRFGANLDFWIQQYTEDGGLGWSQVIDGGVGNDGARGAVIGGSTLFVAGYTAVTGQSNNIWLRGFGLDGSGGITIPYNGPANGSDVGNGIALDPGGNVLVAGYEGVATQGSNVWVREHTPAGAAVWTAGYNGPATTNDRANAVATDAMGNVAVAGFHEVSGQGRDVWVRVYDTNGAPLWTATYSGPAALNDEALGVAFDAMGNVVVGGYEADPVIPWRTFLRKYDPMGVELWSQPWEGQLAEGAYAIAIAIDGSGDIVLTGQHRNAGFSQLLVRKLDPNGNERWTTLIDGAPMTNQVGRGVTIGPDDRIWVAGGIDYGVDGRDAYIARIAP